MILRESSGLPKISCWGWRRRGAGSAAGVEPAIGAGSAVGAGPAASIKPAVDMNSGDAVELDMSNVNNIREVGIAFESFEEINNNKKIILIIFFIFFFLKSLKINLFNNIINNSKIFIIIIIFFKNFLRSFKLKNLSLLKIIFFFN